MDLMVKYDNLKKEIAKYDSCAVAFSGGVDSSFLSKVAYDVLGNNAIAVTIVSPMLPESELNDAREVSSFIGIKHYLFKDEEIEEVVATNPKDRCYHCKKTEFGNVKNFALEKGISIVFDGTNLDDVNDYRPGMKAVSELGVISPLKDAGLTKQDIRDLSKMLNLKTWDKPSFACLASRIPYGDRITVEKLSRVEKAEAFLKSEGFIQYRVRVHDDIARIEIAPEERAKMLDLSLMDKISKTIKEFGFKFVCIELEGYSLGSMNKLI